MYFKMKLASMVAVAATMTTAVLGTTATRAAAQDLVPDLMIAAPAVSVVQPIASGQVNSGQVNSDQGASEQTPAQPASLGDLVDAQPQDADLSREMKCLAGAIYFESKGETLAGQLAVGRVVVARSTSGRFPGSYCGVVYQPSQFSFIRGRAMPAINTGSRGWHEAVAIAQIADAGSFKSSSEGALFFHAARVAPHWRMTRLARVDDHIFYR
jgi:spore germination cell wall hydrolase CwlJ-like protein